MLILTGSSSRRRGKMPDKKDDKPYRPPLPHIHDVEGICWCEPRLLVMMTERDVIREFGYLHPDVLIPSTVWKHNLEH